jgi:hypothetical protein
MIAADDTKCGYCGEDIPEGEEFVKHLGDPMCGDCQDDWNDMQSSWVGW